MASKQVYVNDLCTVDTIARRRNVSVGQIINLAKGRDAKKRNFPQPIVGWGCRGVWLWSDVDSWFKDQKAREDRKSNKKDAYLNKK